MSDIEASILDAAIRVFARYGVRRASMADIAEESGVSRQTIYAHFDGKDGVLAAAVDHHVDGNLAAMRKAWAGLTTLDDKLQAYFDIAVIAVYDLVQNSPDADDIIAGRNPVAHAAVKKADVRVQAALAELLQDHRAGIEASGHTVEAVALFLSNAATGIKHAAATRDELIAMLATLKTAVLLMARA